MFETAMAGSLPKPAWLAETQKLWPQWKADGDELRQAKAAEQTALTRVRIQAQNSNARLTDTEISPKRLEDRLEFYYNFFFGNLFGHFAQRYMPRNHSYT